MTDQQGGAGAAGPATAQEPGGEHQHAHAPHGAGAAVQAALALIKALDAEQAMVKAVEPVVAQLEQAGEPTAAAVLIEAQQGLRAALVSAGQLVNAKLNEVAQAAPPAGEV